MDVYNLFNTRSNFNNINLMEEKMKKYGFFGGAFNPPTIAHEKLAIEIAEKYNLDKVFFVPVGNFYKKQDLADENKRFEMLKLISNDKVDALPIELNINKNLNTSEALELINNNYQDVERYFIMGGDNLEKLPTWQNPERCLNGNKFIAIERGKNIEKVIQCNDLLKKYSSNIFTLKNDDLSKYNSTEVREAIKENNTNIIDKMLNKKVYSYIKLENLYK